MAGRKKIEMKKLADKKSRQVTFSKRRSGLFKKANELAMLCAAQMAIVVFSLTGKPYSFGHPNVNAVVQRFLNDQENKANAQHVDDDDAKDDGVVQELNEELNDLLEQLQIEKERGKQLDMSLKADRATCKYDKPIIQLNMDELSDMKIDLQKLQENVKGHLSEMVASSSLLLLNEHGDKSEN